MKLINSSRERSLLGLVIKFLVIDFYCSRIVHLVTAQSIISTNEGHSVVVPRIDTDIDTLLTKLKSELAKGGLQISVYYDRLACGISSHPRLLQLLFIPCRFLVLNY